MGNIDKRHIDIKKSIDNLLSLSFEELSNIANHPQDNLYHVDDSSYFKDLYVPETLKEIYNNIKEALLIISKKQLELYKKNDKSYECLELKNRLYYLQSSFYNILNKDCNKKTMPPRLTYEHIFHFQNKNYMSLASNRPNANIYVLAFLISLTLSYRLPK